MNKLESGYYWVITSNLDANPQVAFLDTDSRWDLVGWDGGIDSSRVEVISGKLELKDAPALVTTD